MLPKVALTNLPVQQAIDFPNAISSTLERFKTEMLQLVFQSSEFSVVMSILFVGESLGPQLIAKIWNVTRFIH